MNKAESDPSNHSLNNGSTDAAENQISGQLPSYITSSAPNPKEKRAPWYKNTAPTYAGIFLWFVFWQDAAKSSSLGGTLSQGVGIALVGLVLSALVCYFMFYLVPGLFGMRTGLPLYIVGTSTFGAQGGFFMPGFLMGLLQFGWLAVNTYFASLALSSMIPVPANVIMIVWGALAAFVGLKGIKYVAKVATFVPLVPLLILLVLLFKTMGGIGSFDPQKLIESHKALSPSAPLALGSLGVFGLFLTYVVGFFATAGAAGVDFGLNNRDEKDVEIGGLMGVAIAIIVTAGISLLIVAGVYGSPDLHKKAVELASAAKGDLILRSADLMPVIMSKEMSGWFMFLLALAAFPPACFSSFIAANSFKTTLPGVNPFLSVGIGAVVSIVLAVTGWAGQVIPVFVIIGASFGPVCGAMAVDFLMGDGKWTGPRAGFNPAGWISWALGFVVGILPNLHEWIPDIPTVPAAPVAAFVVGAGVYWICAKAGLQSEVVPLPKQLALTTR